MSMPRVESFTFDGRLVKPKNLRGYHSFWTDGLSFDIKTSYLGNFFNLEDHYSVAITAVSNDVHAEMALSAEQNTVVFTGVAHKKKMIPFFFNSKNHFGAAIYSSDQKEIRVISDHDKYCAFLLQPEQKYKIVITKTKAPIA